MSQAHFALEVADLCVSQKKHFFSAPTKVLEDVAFHIRPGTICAFLGANGAGKTTCVRAILGLLRPDKGVIRLFGEDARSHLSRTGLAYLPERPYLPMKLTGYEFVLGHARLGGLKKNEARKKSLFALEEVGLSSALHRPLGTYSKGMLQRVGLAQVISQDPRLLVLDEPLSGLDPQGRLEVRQLIAKQRGLGRTVLFSTHVLADVALLCDQVLILRQGKLIHNDTPNALEDLTRDATTLIEIAFDALEPTHFEALEGLAQEARKMPKSAVFTASNHAAAMQLVDRARALGLVVRSLVPVGGGLEHLFSNH